MQAGDAPDIYTDSTPLEQDSALKHSLHLWKDYEILQTGTSRIKEGCNFS